MAGMPMRERLAMAPVMRELYDKCLRRRLVKLPDVHAEPMMPAVVAKRVGVGEDMVNEKIC